jgi:hypothetical protein
MAGSATLPKQQGTHRDAELTDRQHQRDMLHRVERGLRGSRAFGRARFDLGPLRSDHREFGGDEE